MCVEMCLETRVEMCLEMCVEMCVASEAQESRSHGKVLGFFRTSDGGVRSTHLPAVDEEHTVRVFLNTIVNFQFDVLAMTQMLCRDVL